MTSSVTEQLKTKAFVPLVGICGLLNVAAYVLGAGYALAGAALGTAVLLFTALTTIALHPVLARTTPWMGFAAAFGLYWLKISLLGIILTSARLPEVAEPLWFGVVVISGTCWWMTMHLIVVTKARIPVLPEDE